MMGLLPLIAAIAVAIFAVRRGAAHKVRGGGRRGVAARLACAALALGMLAVIAGSTWRSVFAPVEQTAGMAPCHLPTLPPPQRESDPGRVLVQMAVMRGSMAVKVEEFAVRLPEDIGHDFEFSRVVEGAQIGISYRLDRVPALDGTAPTWGDGQCSVSMRRWDEDISTQSPPEFGPARAVIAFGDAVNGPWSLFYGDGSMLRVLVRSQVIDPADPLRLATSEEVGRTLYRSVMAQDQAELQPASHASILPGTIYKVGGKPAFALVLAAAALLAQLYVRRMIAFAGCLGACMLFCATLDHLVVDRIAMVASDAQAPAATRARSLDALGGTVFFRHAGYRIASGLAADGSAPAGVRDAAAAAADCLLLRLDDQPDRVRAASVNTF